MLHSDNFLRNYVTNALSAGFRDNLHWQNGCEVLKTIRGLRTSTSESEKLESVGDAGRTVWLGERIAGEESAEQERRGRCISMGSVESWSTTQSVMKEEAKTGTSVKGTHWELKRREAQLGQRGAWGFGRFEKNRRTDGNSGLEGKFETK